MESSRPSPDKFSQVETSEIVATFSTSALSSSRPSNAPKSFCSKSLYSFSSASILQSLNKVPEWFSVHMVNCPTVFPTKLSSESEFPEDTVSNGNSPEISAGMMELWLLKFRKRLSESLSTIVTSFGYKFSFVALLTTSSLNSLRPPPIVKLAKDSSTVSVPSPKLEDESIYKLLELLPRKYSDDISTLSITLSIFSF
ncbi:hypothetical protein V8G54_029573 [Vigna mungo]|uniref:Uncharacterized protein n=1 Tax=Vigna mungo TaxID=3915 RepID=A0AAQ3RLK4_VIGMU